MLKGKSGESAIDFGSVEVGQEVYAEFLICNEGGAPVTVEEVTSSDGFSAFWDVWWSGDTIQGRQCRDGWAYFVPGRVGRHEGSVVAKAIPAAASGAMSIRGIGTVPPGSPITIFGEGTFLVGLTVAPGRYHADPNGACALLRTSKYPAQAEADYIGSSTTWFDPGHWIVDLLPSDAAFYSFAGCGWWDQWPGRGPSGGTIPHGVWEVNRHVQPGRYQTESGPGCRWERLRHFQWTPGGVIETQQAADARTQTVTIRSSDAGFLTTPECDVWKRIT